ncbi:PQQ-like domain-containing protein [Psychrobacillus sp. OK028]|uniref:carbohydrate binding domain-containing protein n=1 Tax=Psychrobacillus sp. OK028 TaxID=1884359 RepID=UPI00087F1E14|nr:carbohydrate binding domain-containing protein [Psychrobacillus sp. OK028]SDN56785.1 PQQ-like domain-containing protein [Psychrobacillus sp. OK028]
MKNNYRLIGHTIICTMVVIGLLPSVPATTFAEEDSSEKIVSQQAEEISKGIVNAGFEMPLEDEKTITGWTPDSGTPGVSLSTEKSNTGTQSLKFEDGSDKAGLRVLSEKVAVIPGESYLAKVMTNVESQTHNIVYEVHYYDGKNNEIKDKVKIELFGNLPKNQWTELKVFTDVPENAAYARLAFYSGAISLTKAFFDDVTWELAAGDVPLDRNYETPVNHGEMVQVQLGQASVIQENSLGENEVYYHSNGLPGTFSVLDAETGELKFSQVIADTEALWAMTVGSDKNVYFAGTADGKLYRYLPEEKKVEELGANPSDVWVWDIEASTDGKIYGSTYPHASVFEYDIATGKFRDYGNVKEGQQYARGIAVTDKYIYVGIGTTKHLFKIDRATGEKEEVDIEGHSGQAGMIENMFIVNGKLLVSVGSITMLVLDLETNEILNTFSYSNMISEPSPLNENIIYYKFKNELFQYDFELNKSTLIEGIPLLPDTVRVKDMEWINLSSGETVLAMVTQYGEYIQYNPTNNTVEFIELDISSQAVAIQALHSGEDGKLYMGGYQRGLSIYNPFTDEIEVNIPSFAQPEGIGFLNGKVYYGTYVGAIMYSYDPLKPVDLNSNPNFEYDITDHQDRPFTITSGDDKLFVGTVPDYGVLGGVLAIYDEKTDTWSQYRNVVQDQSIIGLAYKDGKLYGSTSVWGGLGIDPKATEAKIFVWDVKTGQKIEEFTPEIPGIDETPRMIGELSFGPDGNLWGAIDGTIFAMNPDTKEIVKSKVIRPSLYNSSKWLPYRLQWAPDGMLYTTLSRKLIAIDPETLAHKVLVEDFMNNMTVGANGSIYYALGSELHEIAIPETDATLSTIKVDGEILTNFTPGLQKYTVSAKDKTSLVAEASQPGAQVNIIDGDEISIIQVSATDGKSVKEYRVHWVNKPEYAVDITATFVGKKNNIIEKLLPNEKITANVEVFNKQNKNQDILMLLELLNEEGNVVGSSQSSRTIPKNKTMKMSSKLNMPADVKGYALRLTVWEGKKIKENMVPVSDEFIIKN